MLNLTKKVYTSPIYFLAFGFGSGLMPKIPGTWGTLAALPLYLLMSLFSPLIYLVFIFGFFFLGVWVSEKVTQDLGQEDYSGIVWDEIVGFLVTMFYLPFNWLWIFAGFILFRFFDILKPGPIALVDKHIKGGLGVMLDDLLAGIFSCAFLHILVWFLHL